MNCKQGDLAIVVRSCAGNEGKIVRCLEWIGCAPEDDLMDSKYVDCWRTDVGLKTAWGLVVYYAKDSWLRPIRGDLLDNETERETERAA